MFFIKVLVFISLFASFAFGQETPRPQKIEELRKLDSQIEQVQSQLDKMQERKHGITKELLAVTSKDDEEAVKVGAKAIRLFPDKVLDGLIDFADDYEDVVVSTEIVDHYLKSRIEYKNNSLEFVKAEENAGLIANVGETLLETIRGQNREFAALAHYQPPRNLKDVKNEYSLNGLTFKNSAEVVVGNTYLARSIRYGIDDKIFALKVFRKDTDGSIILFVREIKTFEPPAENVSKENQTLENQVIIPDYATAHLVQSALIQKGLINVTVEATTSLVTLRGTIPKGKMAEAVQTAQEAGRKPVKNELTEN